MQVLLSFQPHNLKSQGIMSHKRCPDFPGYQQILYKNLPRNDAQRFGTAHFFSIFQREFANLTTKQNNFLVQFASTKKRSEDEEILRSLAANFFNETVGSHQVEDVVDLSAEQEGAADPGKSYILHLLIISH